MICWKIRIFAYWTTPPRYVFLLNGCCDLLKNSYLCLLNNTPPLATKDIPTVVICWKIRIFAYWTTPEASGKTLRSLLWFAEKFVSLLIEQHLLASASFLERCCDLLKNSYLCLLNNTYGSCIQDESTVVICWKIRIFAYWTTPGYLWLFRYHTLWFAEKFVSLLIEQHLLLWFVLFSSSCDLLKNSYLCLLNNTPSKYHAHDNHVVICWKIRIFAYWTTPFLCLYSSWYSLWFAEKFVSLLIEQHHGKEYEVKLSSCDLLKNSYLCLLNNTLPTTA